MKKGHDIVATEKINIYKQKVVLGDFFIPIGKFLDPKTGAISFFSTSRR